MELRQSDKSELSDREREILRLVATGASNKEIANALFISANTVKVHLRNIFTKINASSRTEAAMYAVKLGLVSAASDASTESGQGESSRFNQFLQTTRMRWLFGIGFGLLIILIGVLTILLNTIANNNTRIPNESLTAENTPRWQTLSPLPTARYGLAVIAYGGNLYAISGSTGQEATGTVERYDTESDTWQRVSSKPTPVSEISAVVIGGKVYVPGGRLSSGKVTDVMEVYDPQMDTWTKEAHVPIALSGYALAAFEGQLYLFGGWDGEKYLDSVYTYDPGRDTWSGNVSLPSPRAYSGAAVSGRKIFVIGGYDGENALSNNEILSPDSIGTSINPWQTGDPLPEAEYAMGVASIADLIYVVGGKGSQNPRYTFLVYRDQSSEWQAIESAPRLSKSYPGFTSIGGTLYVVGGDEGENPVDGNLAYQAFFTISFPIIR
jgi:DNA-binding CsgD family transcriptional regulator/N-acetylneuraminic acid mutarotase